MFEATACPAFLRHTARHPIRRGPGRAALLTAVLFATACGAEEATRAERALSQTNGDGMDQFAAGAGSAGMGGVAGVGEVAAGAGGTGVQAGGTGGIGGGSGSDDGTLGEAGTSGEVDAPDDCSGKAGLPGLTPRTLMVGGVERKFLLYIPASVEPNAARPVVFAHHGMTMTGEEMRALTDYDKMADEKGFVVAFPDGVGTSWNTGFGATGWGGLAGSTADDFGFVEAMLNDIEAEQCIDRTRVFTTGMSMGGYFSNHIGCGRPDLVRAIAPHSGGRELEAGCVAGPKPVMILHGTLDLLITYPDCGEGARNAWVAHNGCSTEVDVKPVLGGTCEYSRGCPPNGQVVLCKFEAMGHGWAGHVGAAGGGTQYEDSTRLTWDFFAAQ